MALDFQWFLRKPSPLNVFRLSDHCHQWFFDGFLIVYHRFQWFLMVPDHWSNDAMVLMDRHGLIRTNMIFKFFHQEFLMFFERGNPCWVVNDYKLRGTGKAWTKQEVNFFQMQAFLQIAGKCCYLCGLLEPPPANFGNLQNFYCFLSNSRQG